MQLKTDANMLIETARKNEKKGMVLIVGLGNILLKDEGIGVHVAERLAQLVLPDNVEVIDGGTAGLDILLLRKNLAKLVVIDAMKAGGRPGTVYKASFKAAEREKLASIFDQSPQSKISLHQAGLIDALAAAEKIGRAPAETVIIGVEPRQCDCGLELTQNVKKIIPKVIKKVLEEI